MGNGQHNPPKEERDPRYVRVIHPHHPLVGQVFRVVRQAGHTAYSERQWIIELADQSRISLPLSWAVVDNSSRAELEEPQAEPHSLWVDVTALLNLASMVHHLNTQLAEKGVSDGQPIEPDQGVREVTTVAQPVRGIVAVGATSCGTATGTGAAFGSAGPQAAVPSSSEPGRGER